MKLWLRQRDTMRIFLNAVALVVVLAASSFSMEATKAPHYQVRLTLAPEKGTVSVEVVITLPAETARTGAGFLLGRGYKVSSVSAEPNATASVADTDKPFPGLQRVFVQSRPESHGDVNLKLVYSGPLSPTGNPPINEISADRVELSADSLWYPLSENFNTRLTLDAVIKGLSRDFVVASADQVLMRGNGFQLHRSRPLPDIAFIAAPGLKVITKGHLQFVGRNLESDEAKDYLENGPKALAFLEKWFGPLPAGRATVAIVERKNGTGYSRPGYIVVADLGQPVDPTNLWAKAGYLCHELSHAWWSNANFMGEDYWLVESTAEYVALRYLEAQYGVTAIQGILDKKKPRAVRGGPLLGNGRPSDDAVYAKGPLLLFELEKTIGRPSLDKILATLSRRETLTTRDFLDQLTKIAGSGAATDFEKKLRS
jgi:hypothetical protein